LLTFPCFNFPPPFFSADKNPVALRGLRIFCCFDLRLFAPSSQPVDRIRYTTPSDWFRPGPCRAGFFFSRSPALLFSSSFLTVALRFFEVFIAVTMFSLRRTQLPCSFLLCFCLWFCLLFFQRLEDTFFILASIFRFRLR